MNVETAEMLRRKIGTFIGADHDNARAGVGRFLRVRIEIDINKPLKRFITLKTKGTYDVHRGRLSYEMLPIFCYNCGIVDHIEAECDKEETNEGGPAMVQQYGAWMRASPLAKKIYNHDYRKFTSFSSASANQGEVANQLRFGLLYW